jgi:hypothetical protein
MKIKLKAVAVDDVGNEQEIEIELRAYSVSRTGGQPVHGTVGFYSQPGHFVFQPKGDFDPFGKEGV